MKPSMKLSMKLGTRSALTAIFASLLLWGCAVEAPQVDMVRSALPETRGSGIDLADYGWKMSFNGTETLVYAIEVGDGIVFANRDGLQIGFDGWDVVLVEGMAGAMGPIRVRKGEAPRAPRSHEIVGVGAFEVICAPARRVASGWRTECSHEGDGTVNRMNQVVELDAAENIVRIESHLLPGVGPMVLEPAAR
jgi:hypothetical protein